MYPLPKCFVYNESDKDTDPKTGHEVADEICATEKLARGEDEGQERHFASQVTIRPGGIKAERRGKTHQRQPDCQRIR